jgi:hypothetical protein
VKVFTCIDHETHFVGGASIIVAETEEQAHDLLVAELLTHGLEQKSKPTLYEIDTTKPKATVLYNGDY